MANLCSNIVQFKGDEGTLKQIRALFENLAAKEAREEQGQIPAFITQDDGFMFDIRWEDEQLFYTTKWSPNLDTMLSVANHYKVEYSHFYCEPGSLLYGEAIYENGNMRNIILTAGDFKSYRHDKENDRYIFEEAAYDDVYEIWEMLLERRKQNSK